VVEKEDPFSLAPASAVAAPGPVPAAPTAPPTATTTTALGRPEGPEEEEADARDSGISLSRPLVLIIEESGRLRLMIDCARTENLPPWFLLLFEYSLSSHSSARDDGRTHRFVGLRFFGGGGGGRGGGGPGVSEHPPRERSGPPATNQGECVAVWCVHGRGRRKRVRGAGGSAGGRHVRGE
jgi:hypothetical protein